MAKRSHPFPFRTRQLSSFAPTILDHLDLGKLVNADTRAYENMVAVAMANPNGDNAGCSCAYSPICWDRNGKCVDNTVLLADDKAEGILYAEFDMEAIREYRNREMIGNTFRKVEAYSQLLNKEIKEPFIRPGQNELLKQSNFLN